MKHSNSQSKAFTLIDILLTAAIVSLLSSLFLFQVSEARKKANDAHMKTEAQQVSNAIALYKNDNNGRVPLHVTAVSGSLYPETDPKYKDTMQLLVAGGYIPEIPKSPDGQSYTYATDANNNAFFAFKLKQGGSSSNRKNSCPANITVTGGVKTFTGCIPDPGVTCSGGPGVQCFNSGTHNLIDLYFEDCGCSGSSVITRKPTMVPVEICLSIMACAPTRIIVPNLPPQTCTYVFSGDPGTPSCNGSSTGDYCECL